MPALNRIKCNTYLGSSLIGFQKWEADKSEGEDSRPGSDAEHGLPVSQIVEDEAPRDPTHSVDHALHGGRDGEKGVVAYVNLGIQLKLNTWVNFSIYSIDRM